jgi:hypothetical protein
MLAQGLEQNDLRLFKVSRYNSSVIIPHMRPKTKTLGYLGAQTSHPNFSIWWHGTHAMIGLGYLGAWIVVIPPPLFPIEGGTDQVCQYSKPLMKFQKKKNNEFFFIDDLFIDANLIDHKYIKT